MALTKIHLDDQAQDSTLDDSLIPANEISLSKLVNGTSAQIQIASAGGVWTAQTLGTDATITAGGALSLATGSVDVNELVTSLASDWNLTASTGFIKVKEPVALADVANKSYVDSVAAGLDPKESCRLATTAVLAGTMTADDVAPTTGNRSYDVAAKTITWFALQGPATLDGEGLINGDRILVKDESATSGPLAGEGRIYNGIYVRTSADVWTRAADHDGTPANEVSAGNFTFVEQGAANIDNGFVLQGDGILTLQTDNIIFVQFSGAGSVIDGAGIVKTGNKLDVELAANKGLEFDVGGDEGKLQLKVNGTSFQLTAGGLELKSSVVGSGLQLNAGVLSTDLNAVFTDKETPTGSLNSLNRYFLLVGDPETTSDHVYLNGILQDNASITPAATAANLTFVNASIDVVTSLADTSTEFSVGDVLRSSNDDALGVVAFNNTPIPGTLRLANVWDGTGVGPATGEFISINDDYAISGKTFVMAVAPTTGGKIRVSYRI